MLDISDRGTLAVVDVTLTGADDPDDMETATGTYGGIQGTFTCTTGDCVFEIGENEDEFTGTVSFQPDEPSVYVADTAYVYFGWWLRKPGSGMADSMMIESFAGGTAPIGAVTALTDIGGKATYNGSAGGKYVVVEAGAADDDTDNDAEVGHFDANVILKADFEDDCR